MMIDKTLLILTLVFLVLAASGTAYWALKKTPTSPATMPTVTPTKRPTASPTPSPSLPDQTGDLKTIHTKVNENFFVVLETNPTTGYQWDVNFSENYIKLVNRDYTSAAPTGILGAGGQETFTFQAIKSGETEIVFSYLRPWEKEKEPEKTVVYSVIVGY